MIKIYSQLSQLWRGVTVTGELRANPDKTRRLGIDEQISYARKRIGAATDRYPSGIGKGFVAGGIYCGRIRLYVRSMKEKAKLSPGFQFFCDGMEAMPFHVVIGYFQTT